MVLFGYENPFVLLSLSPADDRAFPRRFGRPMFGGFGFHHIVALHQLTEFRFNFVSFACVHE